MQKANIYIRYQKYCEITSFSFYPTAPRWPPFNWICICITQFVSRPLSLSLSLIHSLRSARFFYFSLFRSAGRIGLVQFPMVTRTLSLSLFFRSLFFSFYLSPFLRSARAPLPGTYIFLEPPLTPPRIRLLSLRAAYKSVRFVSKRRQCDIQHSASGALATHAG